MESSTTVSILILACLILMSSYFSASETAFSTVNKIRLKNMISAGNKKAKLALELAEDYDNILYTILIGNNIVNIGSASLATVIFVKYFGDIGVTLSTVVMTVIVLIFGEITPKSLAKERPETFTMFSAPILKTLSIILKPISALFHLWKKFIYKIIEIETDKGMTEEELITIVEEATLDGGIPEHEGELIRSAIEFNDLDATDVLTPRTNVVAIEDCDSVEEILAVFEESGYSRLPVYNDTIDNIVGALHLKDFYTRKTDNIKEIIKPVIYTSDTIKISKLMALLQEKKTHLAIVTDEYGGTLGIVTLEDIVEELVGEIWDEHDDVVTEFVEISETEYKIDGGASLEKMLRLFDIDNEEDSSTVNGWVTTQMGDLPKIGDSFEYENLSVKVLSLDGRIVNEIYVKVNEKDDEEDDD